MKKIFFYKNGNRIPDDKNQLTSNLQKSNKTSSSSNNEEDDDEDYENYEDSFEKEVVDEEPETEEDLLKKGFSRVKNKYTKKIYHGYDGKNSTQNDVILIGELPDASYPAIDSTYSERSHYRPEYYTAGIFIPEDQGKYAIIRGYNNNYRFALDKNIFNNIIGTNNKNIKLLMLDTMAQVGPDNVYIYDDQGRRINAQALGMDWAEFFLQLKEAAIQDYEQYDSGLDPKHRHTEKGEDFTDDETKEYFNAARRITSNRIGGWF